MKKKLATSFDELLQDHYGRERRPAVSNEVKVAALLANYYGKPAERHHHHKTPTPAPAPALMLSMSRDDGELLPQRAVDNRFREYVTPYSIADVPYEEYVVEGVALSRPSSTDAGRDVGSAEDRSVREEYVVDILQPLKDAGIADMRTDAASSRPVAAPPTSPTQPRPEARSGTEAHDAPVSSAKSNEADFIADMQSILSGQTVFDPRTKKTIPIDQLGQTLKVPEVAAPAIGPNTSDAIFAKLAQSMQYANVYDIGTVELENRFADFDKIAEIRKRAADEKKAKAATPTAATPARGPAVGSAEFIQDLDEIRRQQVAATQRAEAPQVAPAASPARPPEELPPVAAAASLSAAQSFAPGISRPLFDTGEHVLVAGNAYVEQLRVGANPGVRFSYGQIIALADLFESVEQMMTASPDELARIKALIERSTAYYVANRSDPAKDVSDGEWDTVTGHRYLKLAEMNFEHFSPNFVFRNATFAGAAGRHGNNKAAWEAHHQRAIKEAQAIGAAATGAANSSPLLPLEVPLITNAFGDHFLTDAFSAGHVINKDAIVEFWKTMFFTGARLLPEGKAFFNRLAEAAFARGDVRAKFSGLETVETYFLFFHPNINSADRFASVLAGIAEKEPDRIGNMVVKAIHDRLNADGVEVFNNAGDGTWRLTGDGTLDAKNRQIIQRAVEQSIGNINDPSIMASNLDYAACFAKVWKHVPQLTAASQQSVQRVVRQYVVPDSTVLIEAAARIIEKRVDMLITELIAAKALRRA